MAGTGGFLRFGVCAGHHLFFLGHERCNLENAGEEAPVRHGVSNGSWDIFLVSCGCKRFKIYKQHHQPAPSKGCQMVPLQGVNSPSLGV